MASFFVDCDYAVSVNGSESIIAVTDLDGRCMRLHIRQRVILVIFDSYSLAGPDEIHLDVIFAHVIELHSDYQYQSTVRASHTDFFVR